jgi:hypothetical protein
VTARLGKCPECRKVYSWTDRVPLSKAVCPVHGTPLARTTRGSQQTIVKLPMGPTAKRAS